jgi:hypothetical protein
MTGKDWSSIKKFETGHEIDDRTGQKTYKTPGIEVNYFFFIYSGCSKLCPLEKFLKLTAPWLVPDASVACKAKNNTIS